MADERLWADRIVAGDVRMKMPIQVAGPRTITARDQEPNGAPQYTLQDADGANWFYGTQAECEKVMVMFLAKQGGSPTARDSKDAKYGNK